MTTRTRSLAALLSAGLLLGGCKDIDAPNQNAGTLDDLLGTPSRAAVPTATQGLFSGMRGAIRALQLGILGREAYSLDVSNPQNTPQFYTVHNQLTAYWTGAYTNNKQASVILTALDNVVGMTDGEKEGSRGFVKTVKAYLLFTVIRETDVGGAALEPLEDPTDPPPAIVSKDEVYAQILDWLDEAQAHLQSPGAAFPFTVTAGFSNFRTPATFLQFNRALRAKVNLTWAKYADALTDLGGSFLNPAQPMSRGAYHTYSTLSGDAQNGMYDPTARQRYAHGSFATDAKVKADGVTKDDRFTSKIYSIAPFNRYGFNVAWAFKRYPSNVEPIPILKNEELLLIRAEANIALGTTTGADPRDDINTVRRLGDHRRRDLGAVDRHAATGFPAVREAVLVDVRERGPLGGPAAIRAVGAPAAGPGGRPGLAQPP